MHTHTHTYMCLSVRAHPYIFFDSLNTLRGRLVTYKHLPRVFMQRFADITQIALKYDKRAVGEREREKT